MLFAGLEGQPRHVDLLWPLWNVLDLTPEGRGTDWYPQVHYPQTVTTGFLFVFIGAEPRNEWLGDTLKCDEHGYILTGPDLLVDNRLPDDWPLARHPFHLETSLPGIFATGDVRHGSIRRVAGAVGEGSTAIQLVHRYLAEV